MNAHGELLGIARRSRTRLPMEQLESAELSVERGVEGDCHGVPGPRQVTIIVEDGWRASNLELGRELPWTMRRANLFVRGVDLSDSVGRFLRIGEALLEITEANPPCHVMDIQYQGLRAALKPEWRGGVACRVINGARVQAGDRVGMLRKA